MQQPEQAYHRSLRWSVVGSGSVTVLQLLQMMAFARLSGPGAVGDYALAAAVISLGLPLCEAGLGLVTVQTQHLQTGQWYSLLGFAVLWSVSLYALLCALSPFLGAYFSSADLPVLLAWMGLSWAIAPVLVALTGYLQRTFQFGRLARLETGVAGCALLLVVYGAWHGWGSLAMAVGFGFRHVFMAVVLAGNAGFRKITNGIQSVKWRHVHPMLPMMRAEILSRLTEQGANFLDKLVVGRLLTNEMLGFYNLAYIFLMAPTGRLGYMFSRVTFPVFARLQGDVPALNRFFNRTTLDVVYVLFPVYGLILSFSPEIVGFIFGREWAPAIQVIRIMALAGFARTLTAPVLQLIKGVGRPDWVLYWLVLMIALVNGSLWVWLSFRAGASEAAWCLVSVQSTVGLWVAGRLVGWSGVRTADVWLRAFYVLIPVLVGSAVCFWLEFRWAGGLLWGGKLLVWGLYLAWLWFFNSKGMKTLIQEK